MEETSVDVAGYEENYRISNTGKLFSKKLKRNLRLLPNKDGYYRMGLWKDNICKKYYIHRLVAIHFIPNPENKPVVNHKDGNKKNNTVSNLEWVSVLENERHSRTVLGKITPNGIHVKPITLVKEGIDYTFDSTREAIKFLKAGGKSWKRLQQGLKSTINGYGLKNVSPE